MTVRTDPAADGAALAARRCRAWRPAALALAALLAAPAAAEPAGDTALAYCSNLADAAQDARYARKLARLQAAEARIEERLAALEEKRAQTEDWLTRRQAFLARAEASLVDIYAGMRPEAASEQLAEMDDFTAAAVIAKVAPRAASAILNEMEPRKAARIASIMAGLSRTESGKADG